MKIPLKWLKEYINIKISSQKLADKLTMSGTEIESLFYQGFDKVVVGEIMNIEKHPYAEKLQITKVNVDSKALHIVCGAANINVGQKVPVALEGAYLGEFEIKKTNICGVESEGMLCSEAELGISDDHIGIMVLDPRAKIGSDVASALDIGGVVLDAEITPNRGDLLSILGIAHELEAVLGPKVKSPKITFTESLPKTQDYIKVEVKDFDWCLRYMARVVKVPKVGKSPKWMRDKLAACGLRPVNAIVDITNYVMLEYGQPLHAFDGEKIEGSERKSLTSNRVNKKIIIRRAKNGENIQTLDGIERKLTKENLVIADFQKPIALAGIMGGANSEVGTDSKTIVLESAKFNKVNVRRTSNLLGLRTEAVIRFEREVPFNLPEVALSRACQLLQQICGASIFKNQIDIFENKPKKKAIKLDTNRVEKILGIKIPISKIINILKSLKFQLVRKKGNIYSFVVPWWRLDVSIPEDLIEEIVRIYGYDKIPTTLPSGQLPEFTENREIAWSQILQNILVSLGFYEICTYSFIGESLLKKVNLASKNHIKIINPLTSEQEYMRQSLIPSLLEVVKKNLKNFDRFRIFEIAKIYLSDRKSLPTEERRITGAIVGESDNSFYETKDIVRILLQSLGIFYSDKNIEVGTVEKDLILEESIFHTGRVAQLKINNNYIGLLGEADIRVLNNFHIKKRVGLFSLSLDKLFKYATTDRLYIPISKFPPSRFDLAMVVDKEVSEIEAKKIIIKASNNLLYEIDLFDIYSGKQLGKGKKNLAYHIVLQAKDHTLDEKEVNKIRDKMIKDLKKKIKAQIRNK